MAENINVPANETITIPFSRPSMTHKCIICKAKSPLVVIPSLAKLRVFVKRGLIIHGKARCCKRHLKGSSLTSLIQIVLKQFLIQVH